MYSLVKNILDQTVSSFKNEKFGSITSLYPYPEDTIDIGWQVSLERR